MKEYLAILSFFYMLLLFVRFRENPFYNKSVNNFIHFCEASLFWVTIVGVVHAVIKYI